MMIEGCNGRDRKGPENVRCPREFLAIGKVLDGRCFRIKEKESEGTAEVRD